MELSNEKKELLSQEIANVVVEYVLTKKIEAIFLDVDKGNKRTGFDSINISVVYTYWLDSKERDVINTLIKSLQEKTELNILLDYKFSGDYCLDYLFKNGPRYYRFCLGEILYEKGERFKYYQELLRRHSKQESTVASVLPIQAIKKRVLAKRGIPLAS